jgi:asparagine synthase (glutamine-hydrolysing)
MCGIVGMYGEVDSRLLRSMMDIITYRGPDEYDIYQGEECALGHRRLSIIDLETGKQPIFNELKNKCIIYNGEVYNFKELKDGLEAHHDFATNTDTEVILHLYEEEGFECVKKLDGMFAFAIIDEEGLFLARDPLGIKPLYYGEKNNALYFASEIKSLLLAVDDVKEFPPGCYFHPTVGIKSYFDVPEKKGTLSDQDVIMKQIEQLLDKAVVKRLVSDVPLGIFLSGGLDSSLIASIANRYVSNLNTFSVGYEGSRDIDFARRTAEYLNTTHHELLYTKEDMLEILPEVIYHLESFDTGLIRSAIPCFFVSKIASKFVKVVLAGEGSDELFAGYEYLKSYKDPDSLEKELYYITANLYNINLQRVDRMTMAHSVEGRVPFLDIGLLKFAFKIDTSLKMATKDKMEKWILRKTFQEYLPEDILWRTKEIFADGSGSSEVFKQIAEAEISDKEFEVERKINSECELGSKEDLFYYRIFKEYFGNENVLHAVGKSRTM